MNQKRAVAVAVATAMIYTRPAIIAGESIKGLEILTRPHTEGPYARAIFPEDEALERLESGFWVDHPKKLSTLDKAIAEAAEKDAQEQKKEQDEQDAENLKKQQDDEVAQKAPESTATASEQQDEPKHADDVKAAETQPEAQETQETQPEAEKAQESTQEAKADESKPKDGEKVDGAKVPTNKKAKK